MIECKVLIPIFIQTRSLCGRSVCKMFDIDSSNGLAFCRLNYMYLQNTEKKVKDSPIYRCDDCLKATGDFENALAREE